MAVCVVRGTENFNGQIKAFHWATVTPITLLHSSLCLFSAQQPSHPSLCWRLPTAAAAGDASASRARAAPRLGGRRAAGADRPGGGLRRVVVRMDCC